MTLPVGVEKVPETQLFRKKQKKTKTTAAAHEGRVRSPWQLKYVTNVGTVRTARIQ